MEGVIYKYTNKLNGKVYIGQTVDEQRRINNHKKASNNSLFHRAIRKYGFENFDYEVLERVDKSLLNEREIYWIQYYDSTNKDIGYNLTSGGEGTSGYTYTDEQLKRRSEQSKGNKSFSGRHHTEETRKKMSDAQK